MDASFAEYRSGWWNEGLIGETEEGIGWNV